MFQHSFVLTAYRKDDKTHVFHADGTQIQGLNQYFSNIKLTILLTVKPHI